KLKLFIWTNPISSLTSSTSKKKNSANPSLFFSPRRSTTAGRYSVMDKIQHTTVTANGIRIHVASIGSPGQPVILFLHGFPDLWYTWRHQMIQLSSLGYRCLAPDLRGYGDTDSPPDSSTYTVFHVVGDLIGMLDAVGVTEPVFLVGHDWGAVMAWHFCLFRADRVRALVNMSVPLSPRNPMKKPVDSYRASLGDDFYICRFQEPGEVEQDFAEMGAANVIRRFLTIRNPRPPCVPKSTGFRALPSPPKLPPWLTEDDLSYYAAKFSRSGFTGGLNYYRCMDLTWELMAAWTGVQVKVPVKFMVGDLDVTYNFPGAKGYLQSGAMKKLVPFLEEMVVLEGVAHFLQLEKPEEVGTHIHEFFEKFVR
ncbi:Epoxide hydrolase A, partial [Linum perenne]